MILMDAGTTEFDQPVTDRAQSGEVKLGLGVIAASAPRLNRCQHPVRAHDAVRPRLPHHQVIAPWIKRVAVEPVVCAGKDRAEFGTENVMTQALDGLQLLARLREPDDQATTIHGRGWKREYAGGAANQFKHVVYLLRMRPV